MPRHKKIQKRIIESDFLYKSRVVARFINRLMLNGKMSTAEEVVYSALSKLGEDRKLAVKIFEDAVKNVMPKIEVRSRRVGGATYQVPTPLKHDRSEALAVRWIIGVCRKRKGRTMSEKLYNEILAASKSQGEAVKKRDDIHKMAEANRAFAHFRW
ncbi:30S ribosomal protein S7 [candidate division WWE3 bacterium CG09_land_8_20_14_0_10_39_24]|uniref:Small ribosomal subunit protein uS7 n=2 Tax=Katanobacteria TaxID=422282 RepID=A0A2G9XCW3_UNCKA|nr:MAG: 30S ribosomal protein S7 [bacterium CG2_30_40_12]OJI08938.1 MAG: 30S ribosomal protein S7 [bacterium CG09_39_24]PIP04777.1 MAG: 30S ribosomal protein S7 [candidate division WWE3 bacterium CG23_combo_of_CG06-09_8_20_14_all_40_14]PIS12880.1 MAG: 30S ribosomal protein S7 [candidate division WWE3 bacterium CG09_land_8_20_14_0_10_39_24]PJE51865.1 MAG: 30S ribosomal protein S7 [candidate division WWE3 bacterium CG10_big_fil_rev_8_21_14_0_10_39_14]